MSLLELVEDAEHPEPEPARVAGSRFRRHREMLVIASIVVAFAFALEVRTDQTVQPRGIPALTLPPTCASRAWFHLDCPGCGLTRSFIHLAHGDLAASLAAHRIGPLLAVALLLQFPYRITALRRRDPFPLGRRLPHLVGLALIAALIGNWLVGLIFRVVV